MNPDEALLVVARTLEYVYSREAGPSDQQYWREVAVDCSHLVDDEGERLSWAVCPVCQEVGCDDDCPLFDVRETLLGKRLRTHSSWPATEPSSPTPRSSSSAPVASRPLPRLDTTRQRNGAITFEGAGQPGTDLRRRVFRVEHPGRESDRTLAVTKLPERIGTLAHLLTSLGPAPSIDDCRPRDGEGAQCRHSSSDECRNRHEVLLTHGPLYPR